MFRIHAEVTCFLLPDDAKVAEAAFLERLRHPAETWIIAYGFTLAPMIEEIVAVHRAHKKIHVYLDHTQSSGRAQHADVLKLVHAGVDVTIGTSPVRGLICHSKGMVVDAASPWCWEGSVNFTNKGFDQVNTAMLFRSVGWRRHFVRQFGMLKAFAINHERRWQPRARCG